SSVGISNHNKRNAPSSLSNDLGLIGAVLQIIVALLVIVEAVLHRICKTVIKVKATCYGCLCLVFII
ncbi:MAG: hypothetical protein DI539_20605, partial [Flavobacterium psychrophilum]